MPLAKATARQKELIDQRTELARQFRETYASRRDDKSDYPFFIGVFDTVASIASKGSLNIMFAAILALAATAATAFWLNQPVAEIVFGSKVGGFFSSLAALIHFDTASWWQWFGAVISAFVLVVFLWYVTQQVKFAPSADPKKPWRTINISFGRMSFEDKTLNDNVRYARHAISTDENPAAFQRVGFGAASGNRPKQRRAGYRYIPTILVCGQSFRYRRQLS